MSQVKQKDTVKVHYTGKLENGQIFDSSIEREPLEFTLGKGQLIPGFENGVLNMKVNEKKTIKIPQAEAYGEVKKELFHEVEKDKLPEDLKLEIGMALVSKAPDGSERQLIVSEIKDKTIVVNANHPLAGKDLIFELEVLDIQTI
ncbi:MAG: peptidylprolyl isomerase [Bacteroidetes bacterium HGW-Bacteroidetes-2]|jgi:FKBP-type peptidyl-prolyl cis-trans isomerase SlpA|nr:MAG: peptidylprolyl isomerase [Bacteroidetes bacterium HGW-Bacteroidetes-2]